MLSVKEQIKILKKLSLLLRSGMPAIKALELSLFPKDVVRRVVEGAQISDSAKAFFGAGTVSLLRIGELCGSLDEMSLKAGETLVKQKEMKARLIKAVAYPCVVLLFSFISVCFFSFFIVPQLSSVFLSMNAPTPMVLGLFTRGCSLIIMLAVFAAIAVAASNIMAKNRIYERQIAHLTLKLPLAGEIIRRTAVAGIISNLAVLIGAGVSVTEAVGECSEASGNVIFKDALYAIKKDVQSGEKLSAAFGKQSIFDANISQMIAVGEGAGNIREILSGVSSVMEEELFDKIGTLSLVIEPLSTAVVGVFVGIIVFSMMSPLTSMMAALQ